MAIEFHSKLAAMEFRGFENGSNFNIWRQWGGDLQLFIWFFDEFAVILSRFLKIPDMFSTVYLPRDFTIRRNLQSHFKLCRGQSSRNEVSGFNLQSWFALASFWALFARVNFNRQLYLIRKILVFEILYIFELAFWLKFWSTTWSAAALAQVSSKFCPFKFALLE